MSFKCHEPDLTSESSPEDAERYSLETLKLTLSYTFQRMPLWPWNWLRWFRVDREINRRLRVHESYKRATGR